MPEGDSLHRAARRLQALVGRRVEVETPHPRAAALGLAERLDERELESVEAVGKNLLLTFRGGLVLRSHLRMSGRWQVRRRDSRPQPGLPWLVLRTDEYEAILWNGPVLELTGRALRRLGPDILGTPPDLERMVENLRNEHPGREIGDALLDQRLVAGIGNLWRSEALWHAGISPWRRLAEVSDVELAHVLAEAARLMRGSLDGAAAEPAAPAAAGRLEGPSRPRTALRSEPRTVTGRPRERAVYRRTGRPCPRCGAPIRSRGQGDDNRMAYWCPGCQRGEVLPEA
jgi:endonuclease-8